MANQLNHRVLKYRVGTRVLHWAHAVSFVALVVTGIFLYLSPLSFLAIDSWSRVIHRGAAILFMLAPAIYLVASWRASWASVKEALTWTTDDLGWVAAAPGYYFLGDESRMPPQDHINTGQKLWYLILLVSGTLLALTGVLMWWLKAVLPAAVFQWSVFVHDIYFIVVLSMFFVHVYLSVLHPLMRQHGGAFGSMVGGTVSVDYARTHHAKWYRRMAESEQVIEPEPAPARVGVAAMENK
ncbi:MAG: cytochrome b/b6 domain-containing protein [Chloroflexi bacterium]|nr:cytochrome b/b6 domain-containing protein [Chloroflexota bacterium]